MTRLFMLLGLILSSSFASAQSTKQTWTAGWDIFTEPLNFTKSNVTWSMNPTTNKLTVSFRLVSATPNKLYQVGLAMFCTTFPNTFGQFEVFGLDGNACKTFTRQGVTTSLAYVDVGVVTTDIDGTGGFSVVICPIPAGMYNVEFYVRDGAGCNLTGGGTDDCSIDFQSPGPTFGDTTAITAP